ncbi:MAG: RNA polymerase sigma factor, partial [Polyangiaceae bacterium]
RKRSRGWAAFKVLRRQGNATDFVSPERGAIAHELVSRLEQEVASLPYEQRVAFVMCDVEDLPGVEVARALGIPTGTLYRRLHHARKRLRAVVEGGETR